MDKTHMQTHSRYRTARRILLFWTLFIGVGAVAGAAGMLLDPSGRALGMDAMLPYFQVLPFADVLFRDLTFSGWALLIVNGLTNLTAAGLLLAEKRAGVTLGGLFGVTLMLWICIQFYMFPQKIVCRKWILPAAAAAILIVVLLARFWPTNSKTTTPDNQDTSENTTATDNQNTTGDTSTDVIPEPKKDEEPAEAAVQLGQCTPRDPCRKESCLRHKRENGRSDRQGTQGGRVVLYGGVRSGLNPNQKAFPFSCRVHDERGRLFS